MATFLGRLVKSFRNAMLYFIVYFFVIWIVAYYLGYLSSREPFTIIFSGFFIILNALCFGFGTEYARLSMKYRKTDFSKARQALRDFTYDVMVDVVANIVVLCVWYLLRLARVFP
jgi:hypothetical protein